MTYICTVLPFAGLLKSSAVRSDDKRDPRRDPREDVPLDERICVGLDLMSANVPTMLRSLYPSLYILHDPRNPQIDWGTPGIDGK